jgi:hypothetical protein
MLGIGLLTALLAAAIHGIVEEVSYIKFKFLRDCILCNNTIQIVLLPNFNNTDNVLIFSKLLLHISKRFFYWTISEVSKASA